MSEHSGSEFYERKKGPQTVELPDTSELRKLPFGERLDLLPELLGVEAQLLLHTMGQVGPVKYQIADLMRPKAWSPRYLVRKAPGVDGPPIPDDEPVLVIRAQDRMAPMMLSTYIERYKGLHGSDRAVISELLDHLEQVILWQEAHPDRVKVADR